MKKQTAVEWLVSQLKSQGLLIGEPDNLVAVKQANEMFKEHIMDAWDVGKDSFSSMSAEQYYNETFKSE